jgi:hypothetical protein
MNPQPDQSCAPQRRSSMFFVSDVRGAAETAAFALEEHGLTACQVDMLADELEERTLAFFAEVRDRAESDEGRQS